MIPLSDEIYFFETEGRELRVHTADRIFTCSYKLYEREELLPGSFMRISKSTIANLDYSQSKCRFFLWQRGIACSFGLESDYECRYFLRRL